MDYGFHAMDSGFQVQSTPDNLNLQGEYSGAPLYGHPLYTDSFVCPDKKLIYFL